MIFRSLRAFLLILAGLVSIAASIHEALSGQDASNTAFRDEQSYRVIIGVDLVNIPCSVLDKNTNSFITTLTRNDFTVYEDNEKQSIQNFARESNFPLTIEKDRATLVEFDSGVTLLQDFTSDPNKMAKQIAKLRAAGGTALYDAIYMICDEKMIRERGRKTIIILSDGEDRSSDHSFNEAMEMALRAEATIFSISVSKGGFFGVGDSQEGDEVLKDMARETGGKTFFPFKVEDLDDAFRQINQELRSQYNLGYVSTNPRRDGSYRKIEIKVQEKGLKLNYRKGYYAPKG